jgi:signal transduction histidine kinase
LNGILGFAELLQQDLAGQPRQNFANAIHQSGQHLLTLVNSLLDLAHVEANKIQVNLANEDLPALLQRAVGRHRPGAESKNLSLEIELAPDLPVQCRLDRTRLAQVLDTLLENAIKFTTTGGIRLSAMVIHEFLRFDIADTGPGIDSEFHFEIFDKFTQVDGSERRGHGGAGLGLALARKLVQLMGGRIWVESSPGKGSHFKFTVPIVSAQ